MNSTQTYAILIGAIVPLGGYVLNRYAPWVTEPVKAVVQIVLAAIASALYTAVDTDILGWNTPTLKLVISGVFAALIAHKVLWQPSGINAKLGAEGRPVGVLSKPKIAVRNRSRG